MNEIKGLIIEEIYITADGENIRFIGGYKDLWYRTETDCCAECYIYEINGIDALIPPARSEYEIQVPYRILNIEHKEIDNERIYCATIMTNKGRCDIIYRSDSHSGFYGGDLRFVDKNTSHYIADPYDKKLDWIKVTQDWKLDG